MTMQLRDYGSLCVEQSIDNVLAPQSAEVPPTPVVTKTKLISMLAISFLFSIVFATGSGRSETNEVSIISSPMQLTRDHSPNDPLFYKHQLVDHFAEHEGKKSIPPTWSQRYYASAEHFGGPGFPIFLVIGGEGTLDKMLYPFVNDHLAARFKAYVLQPEHRFYGTSQPLKGKYPSNEELARLLTPEQAMSDLIRLAQHIQLERLNCSSKKSSKRYCPIITVGGSYPGFLSAMMRFRYPDIVDIGYASSAPLLLYSQSVDQGAYYELVTQSAERSSAGCAAAVKSTLMDIAKDLQSAPFEEVADRLGICVDNIPDYIKNNDMFRDESLMIVEDTFADYNMDNYPPGKETEMAKACKLFLDDTISSTEKVAFFYRNLMSDDGTGEKQACFDMTSQMTDGANGTITCADWSGCGDGNDARMWEFQMCSLLIVQTGFSEKSMFPTRKWSLGWTSHHCWDRFRVVPQPYRLVDEWGFDDLVGNGASRILFTNGLNDMWSVGSHLEDLSDTILALNFPNGAHHSDLSHAGPTENDSEDIKEGFIEIFNIIGGWLEDLQKHG